MVLQVHLIWSPGCCSQPDKEGTSGFTRAEFRKNFLVHHCASVVTFIDQDNVKPRQVSSTINALIDRIKACKHAGSLRQLCGIGAFMPVPDNGILACTQEWPESPLKLVDQFIGMRQHKDSAG